MNLKLSVPLALAALLAIPVFSSQFDREGQDNDNQGHSHHQHTGISTNFLRAPYLQAATPNTIYVVWRTETPIVPIVRFGTSVENLDRVVPLEAITIATGNTNKSQKLPPGMRRMHSAPANAWQYEALLSGLQPDSVYYYAIYDGETLLTTKDSTFRFRTQPLAGSDRPFRFWVVGDSGTGRTNQLSVHTAMLGYTAKQNRPLDFYIHVGDMAYTRGRDVEFQSRFFETYESTLRSIVCWPAMGNHEGITSKGTNGVGPYYDAYVLPTKGEAGGLASGTEAYYSFDYGRTHFICLNSHDLDRRPTGAMARWLKADLEQTKMDWIIAYFHHPCYTKGSHDSDREKQMVEMRTHILPILESGGTDLILTGHSHIYERSMLIDGAYDTPTIAENCVLDDREGDPDKDGPYQKSAGIHPNEGLVHVVAGHGGMTLRRKGTIPLTRKTIVKHGSLLVDIKGDTLDAVMLNIFGELEDHFGIVKRSVVNPRRITYPWQPPAYKPPKGPDGKEPPPEPPEDFEYAINRNAEWRYLAGSHPETNWTRADFNDSDWKLGTAGFGYDYKEPRTVLNDMQGNYSVIYMRHEFNIEQADSIAEIGLMISYDDAFIAYLNGKEVARANVEKSGRKAEKIKGRDANGKFSYFPLKDYEKYLRDGRNVLSIEGHNASIDSHDFLIDPYLIYED
jgi:hypothetical protein